MKIGILAENLLERLALAFNLAPTPLVETQVAYNGARAIMAGAALGVYEALAEVPKTADEVAAACKTHPRATRQLLDCLTGLEYVKHSDGRYVLHPRMRKWLLRDSPTSVVDKLIFQLTEWSWMGQLEDFVRTGEPLNFHANMTRQEWAQYQEGMRDLSATLSLEVAKKLKLPANASHMLDIGGSHGLYSIALCRKYPKLISTILELPGAVDRATQIAARQGLGDRVKHQVGNALTDDLGEGTYDLVFISNVVHHFSVPENVMLAKKVKRALKPGGQYVVGEFPRGEKPGEGGAIGATADLYFALTSASGTWSVTEIQAWMREAGLTVMKPVRYLGPAYVSVVGRNG
jgi:2-polyprenyl-3-methyl-5-hydroxy-6-metoxy-1,4-benzoquinol methylase